MSLLTELMRDGAEKDYTTTTKDGKFYAVELVNHPTPSGCDRWLQTYSDNRGWDTPEQAIEELKVILPKGGLRGILKK